jgi:hypothetical protein
MKKEELFRDAVAAPKMHAARTDRSAGRPARAHHAMLTEPAPELVDEDTVLENSHNLQRLKKHHPHLYHHKILNWD